MLKIILLSAVRSLLKYKQMSLIKWIFRSGNDTTRFEIIGVAADFHNEGLQKPIYPIVWKNNYPVNSDILQSG